MQAWWSSVSESDMRCIRAQLQREPRGVVAVARRCRFGFPQVIVTSPVVFGPGRRSERRAGVAVDDPRVFPTLYWLSCPYLVVEVSRLEGEGGVGRVRQWLQEQDLRQMWEKVHRRAACERIATVSPAPSRLLQEEHPAQWQVLTSSGVGGTQSIDGIKCLHAHLADYLAGPIGKERASDVSNVAPGDRNPAGAQALVLLLRRGVDVSGCPDCRCGEWPQAKRLAAIDVGSNSCRLLAVEVREDGSLQKQVTGLKTTRLGEGLQQSGCLRPVAVERTLAAIQMLLVQACGNWQQPLMQVMAVATSALRSATNPEELLLRVWEQLALSLRVICGQEEAKLSFQGVLSGLGPRPHEIAVLDIGGGSTELIVGHSEGNIAGAVSIELGAVRLTEILAGAPDVAALVRMAKAYLEPEMAPITKGLKEIVLVGVGGTCTSLAAIDLQMESYDSDRVQGHILSRQQIEAMADWLADMPVGERRQVVGLQPARADIIVSGAAIALAVLDILQQESMVISDADILWGIVESLHVRKNAR